MMSDSYVRVFIHYVWTTWQREPFIAPAIEWRLYACLTHECEKLRGKVLAVNGIEDHVHLLVQMSAQIGIAELGQQLKGGSSHFVNHELRPQYGFHWQRGYGALSVSPNGCTAVRAYIENQKEHHATGRLRPE